MKLERASTSLLALCCLMTPGVALGQESAAEITKKLSNPVSSLISVPLQNNLLTGIGPLNGYRDTLNIEPVIPFGLTKDWNLVTRNVLPVVTQTNVAAPGRTESGLSDLVSSAFFSPADTSSGFIWGAGPALLFPTATDNTLGTKKWGAGPTAVVLYQKAGWTPGVLINQIWSYAGSDHRDAVDQMYIFPFLQHNWASGAGLGVNADITHDWKHHFTNAVITPNVSGLTRIGDQKLQIQAGPIIPLCAAPDERPGYGARVQITFVFPR